jgi:hypothetical protein
LLNGRKNKRSLVAPLFVAGSDAGGTQIKEAIYPVQIRRCKGPLAYRELGDLAGIVWLDRLPAKNSDIEVFGFVLVANGEELICEEAFVCNWRVK